MWRAGMQLALSDKQLPACKRGAGDQPSDATPAGNTTPQEAALLSPSSAKAIDKKRTELAKVETDIGQLQADAGGPTQGDGREEKSVRDDENRGGRQPYPSAMRTLVDGRKRCKFEIASMTLSKVPNGRYGGVRVIHDIIQDIVIPDVPADYKTALNIENLRDAKYPERYSTIKISYSEGYLANHPLAASTLETIARHFTAKHSAKGIQADWTASVTAACNKSASIAAFITSTKPDLDINDPARLRRIANTALVDTGLEVKHVWRIRVDDATRVIANLHCWSPQDAKAVLYHEMDSLQFTFDGIDYTLQPHYLPRLHPVTSCATMALFTLSSPFNQQAIDEQIDAYVQRAVDAGLLPHLRLLDCQPHEMVNNRRSRSDAYYVDCVGVLLAAWLHLQSFGSDNRHFVPSAVLNDDDDFSDNDLLHAWYQDLEVVRLHFDPARHELPGFLYPPVQNRKPRGKRPVKQRSPVPWIAPAPPRSERSKLVDKKAMLSHRIRRYAISDQSRQAEATRAELVTVSEQLRKLDDAPDATQQRVDNGGPQQTTPAPGLLYPPVQNQETRGKRPVKQRSPVPWFDVTPAPPPTERIKLEQRKRFLSRQIAAYAVNYHAPPVDAYRAELATVLDQLRALDDIPHALQQGLGDGGQQQSTSADNAQQLDLPPESQTSGLSRIPIKNRPVGKRLKPDYNPDLDQIALSPLSRQLPPPTSNS